ncbi:flagellar protein FlgN [Bacillus sp. SCS-151]|uniref:flagellar protein FlgN n=1 Tax=Nanhaiella sioensis TaxID=3115293 RepID=UPI00397D1B74
MSSQKLLQTLESLFKQHESLYDLSIKKVDVIKSSNIESLDKILIEEQKHIAIINKLNEERKAMVYELVSGHPISGNEPTMTDCINIVSGQTKQQLADIQSELIKVIDKLKQQNELNQALIYQSLQYVNLSLDLLIPQPTSFNYEKPTSTTSHEQIVNRSMFDSKA